MQSQPMQLELPPFSQFSPTLLSLLVLGWAIGWAWSLFVCAARSDEVKHLPAWAWALMLLIAPVTVPLFLAVGAPISQRGGRAIGVAAVAAVVVAVGVVALQQIGIMDCRVVDHGLTRVCEREPRSTLLPLALAIAAAALAGGAVMGRGRRSSRMTTTPAIG